MQTNFSCIFAILGTIVTMQTNFSCIFAILGAVVTVQTNISYIFAILGSVVVQTNFSCIFAILDTSVNRFLQGDLFDKYISESMILLYVENGFLYHQNCQAFLDCCRPRVG